MRIRTVFLFRLYYVKNSYNSLELIWCLQKKTFAIGYYKSSSKLTFGRGESVTLWCNGVKRTRTDRDEDVLLPRIKIQNLLSNNTLLLLCCFPIAIMLIMECSLVCDGLQGNLQLYDGITSTCT